MKKLCLLLLIALITQACKLDGKSIQYAEYIDHNPKTKNLSLASFMFHDLNSITTQTLSTYALPWKIVIVSMAMSKKTEISKKAIRGLLQTYGFIFPKKIYGWKGDELVPEFDYRPAGIVTGYMSFNAEDKTAKRIEVSNIGCVTCHGGMDYDKNGAPNFNFVAGRTNSSLQIERFYNDVVIAMAKLDQKAFKKSFLKNVLKIFPLISDNEFKTIKFFIPITVKQVKKLLKKYGRATAYEIG